MKRSIALLWSRLKLSNHFALESVCEFRYTSEGHVFMIEDAFSRLDSYCRKANYKGWDLFDGLNSRLFKKSFFYKSEVFRLAWIQLFKRSPINFRCCAFVPKDHNAKGLGLFVSGLAALQRTEEAKTLLDKLKCMKCDGFEGISWGYNFPWQARAFYVPVGTPNMVTTVFVANAFLDYFDKTGKEEYLRSQQCITSQLYV